MAHTAILSKVRFTFTPNGLYVAAAIRLAIGIILLAVASGSRFPTVLRVLGVLALLGGMGTLFLGVERARAIADWAASQGTLVIRGFGVFALAIGGFIGYAVSGKRASDCCNHSQDATRFWQ